MKVYFLILIIFLAACDRKYGNSDDTKFVYLNTSDHSLYTIAYFQSTDERFELDIGEEKSYLESPAKWSGPLEVSYFFSADSIITIFDDTLAISYDEGRLDGNPMRLDNYELLEGETDPYIYLFEFTNDDYERALDRGRIIELGEYD